MSLDSNHISAYAEPTIGHEVTLEGEISLLVSARHRIEAKPYPKIINLDPSSNRPALAPDATGFLLLEARDIEAMEFGTMAYCEFSLADGRFRVWMWLRKTSTWRNTGRVR